MPNPDGVAREPIGIEQFEHRLLLRSVGTLAGDRRTCTSCGRTPLIGEIVYVYEGRHAELRCELCRLRSESAPSSQITVRHGEHRSAVRILPRAA